MKFFEQKKSVNVLVRLFFILLFGFCAFMPTSIVSAAGATYYVSPGGNDSNPGSLSQPWRTIGKAASMANAGDTVYLRGGVYQEAVFLSRSGTSSAPISFLAYSGETPVLDGNNYTIPAIAYGPLLKITGDYVFVSGLEVRYSRGMGVAITGQYTAVDGINSHHNKEDGILVTGNYSAVTNSEVWSNCMSNVNGSSSSWSAGLSAARYPNDVVLSNNVVHGNWGQGITTYEANGTIMEGNIIYDNWSANVYISDATNVILRNNFIYATGNMTSGDQVGIMMGDERYDPPSANIQIINNIAYGNHRNFFWWQGVQGGGMNNVLIANNTFVNGIGNISNGEGNVIIGRGTHVNVRFQNNLVNQDSSLPVITTIAQAGVYYSNNLWSKTPYAAASGPGDVIGDPKLSRTGSTYSTDWYLLTDASPAIDKALSLGEVNIDYFGTDRSSSPDIGAIEFAGEIPFPATLTVSKTGTGSGTVTSSPTGINCGSTCSQGFTTGTSVTLTATPASGGYDRFLGWSGGGCSGTGTCTVTLYESDQVSAEFEKATFTDVPFTHPRWAYIEALWDGGYTSGCSSNPLKFCPDQTMSRAESAVFMLRGNFGPTYVAPAGPWDRFADDWTPGPWAEKWAEGMWNEGMTAGCSTDPLKFCPWDLFPRVQGAVIGLRMEYGMSYVPPNATGKVFADMTDVNYWGTKWAEQAYLDGLLPACGTQGGKPKFCPDDLLDRSWSAYLIGKAKNLPLP